ncbi:hypothetical protein [Actinoallomurus rhizosphaericola]|uniref:hypothetical protein n=1 Tax=Actinoallomurus rhizosphaericola TaxID=2952536 RepID=UPI002092E90A|nr:hypothetical protein [Actinoallomurus rhizosphaericola]MCO5996175.1 hypothetical protein [Actinoallomurus rhizosphaericola]
MVWGQAYGGAPSAAAQDPFAVVERDTRAMVTAGWWPATPPLQRQNLVAGRMLVLPDGTWWLFGAWARWYRWLPADGQWHLCPPPRLPMTRTSARPLGQGMPVPRIPPHLVPSGPDFTVEPPQSLPFVDVDVRPEVTSRVRATVESAAALPPQDYPHWWNTFSSATPSTVAIGWGVMLWSAAAPVFDSGLDAQLLGLWSPYRARPLPAADGPRWLTPPPLEALVGLYAERLRAHRVDAAVVILRTMWAMASALREDSRFRARADALLAILGATLHNPTVDYAALPYGDQALVQQWLTRCPPALAPALRIEASAGEHFRNAFYDLAVCLASIAGDPAEHGYVEPRLIAAALLAADLAVVRHDVVEQVIGWLDPETRRATQAILTGTDHPLRRFWPQDGRLPPLLRRRVETLRPAARGALLATVYAADLAWCRLGGGIPARPRGFPVPVAVLAEILGADRAKSAAPADPVTPDLAPVARQYPPVPAPGSPPVVPPVAHQPPTGPPGQAPAWAAPPAAAGQAADASRPGAAPAMGSAPPQAVPPTSAVGASRAAGTGEPAPAPAESAGSGADTGPAPDDLFATRIEHDAPNVPRDALRNVPPDASPDVSRDVPANAASDGSQDAARNVAPDVPSGDVSSAVSAGMEADGGSEQDDLFATRIEHDAPDAWNASPNASPNEASDGSRDAASDASRDESANVASDGSRDARVNAPAEASRDVLWDALANAASAAWPGTAANASSDASRDAPEDGASDGSRNAARDVPVDAVQGPSSGEVSPATRAWHPSAEPKSAHGGGEEPLADEVTMLDPPPGVPADATYVDPLADGTRADGWAPVPGPQPGVSAPALPPGPSAGSAPLPPGGPPVPPGPSAQPGFSGPSALPGHPGSSAQSGPPGESAQPGHPGPYALPGPSGPSAQPGLPGAFAQPGLPGAFAQSGHPGSSALPVPPVPPAPPLPAGPPLPPAPVPPTRVPGPPRTRVLGEAPGSPAPEDQPERPGTRIMSQTMMGDLLGAPMPGRPVGEIEPPPAGSALPEVTERFGIRFVSGADDLARLLDDVHRRASSGEETAPALLVVGAPHSGQRRFARLLARTLAGAGTGDGAVRTVDGTEAGHTAETLDVALRGGAPLLLEWIDAALRRAAEPAAVAAAVIRSREGAAGAAALIATCEPGAYDRLKSDFPELAGVFRVFRLPDLADAETRLALVHVLADERRVTVNAPALQTLKADLPRLTGYGDLVNARLVEAYLDRAVTRHTDRYGVPRDRLVLTPEDFTGVAEEIEPALRAPGDVDGFLRTLDQMIGLDEVKETIGGLVAEARLAAAERAGRRSPAGDPSRHLIFLGRPGTGKRTVAGLVGGAYAALGLLDSGQVVVCDARDLAGDDAEAKVAAQVDRAAGGVLLIENASLFDRMSGAVAALLRRMDVRRDEFLVICSSEPGEMDGFLLANPEFRAEFGAIVEFPEPTDRQLVQLFSRFAERELYLLDEELRVELLGRFGEMRASRSFAFAETVRRLFDAIVARQAARLAGARVDAATVARLTVRDLPESPAERLLQSLHQERTGR